jgi:hypothetical protein
MRKPATIHFAIALQRAIDSGEPFDSITVSSKLDVMQAGWLPEAGSPAHKRAMDARRQTSAARTSFSKARTPKALSVGSKKNYITGFPS